MKLSNTQEISILIADDMLEHIEGIARRLKDYGFTILKAQDGITALEIAINQKPSLILLDIDMPGMTGLEVCKNLKTNLETQHIPIIFLTAAHNKQTEGYKVGGIDFIPKPADEENLRIRVTTHLQHYYRLEQHLLRRYAMYDEKQRKKLALSEESPAPTEEILPELAEMSAAELERVLKVRDWIFANLDQDSSLNKLAELAGMNRNKLSHYFKILFGGKSVFEWWREQRMRKAAELLRETRSSIKVISMEVGINDPNYFTYSFKQRFGVSPTEYRRKHNRK